MLSGGLRGLPERGFAAALTNLDAARSLRPCGLRGRAARAMRRRMGRPGPSRRSDCAVGARAFKSRSLPGCDSPQGRAAAPVRAPIARGPRPARACRATLARGPRASASFYPLALDHVLDPIEREGAIDGLGHRLRLDLHGHPAPSSTSAVTTHLDMLTARSGGGAGRSGAARRGSRFRPCRPRTRLWTRRCA